MLRNSVRWQLRSQVLALLRHSTPPVWSSIPSLVLWSLLAWWWDRSLLKIELFGLCRFPFQSVAMSAQNRIALRFESIILFLSSEPSVLPVWVWVMDCFITKLKTVHIWWLSVSTWSLQFRSLPEPWPNLGLQIIESLIILSISVVSCCWCWSVLSLTV